jgi:hypothetical protein
LFNFIEPAIFQPQFVNAPSNSKKLAAERKALDINVFLNIGLVFKEKKKPSGFQNLDV